MSTYFQLRRLRPPFHKVRQFTILQIFAIFQAFSKQCALENLFSNAKTLAALEGGDLESQLHFFPDSFFRSFQVLSFMGL